MWYVNIKINKAKEKGVKIMRRKNKTWLLLIIIAGLIIIIGIILALNKNNILNKEIEVKESKLEYYDNETDLLNIDASYKVNSINGSIMNITINIKHEKGIQKIIKPDNTSITPIILKKRIALDYNVEDEKEYKFKIQLTDSNEEEYVLKANLDDEIQILQNESNTYPIINDYGIEVNKIIKIDYGENTDNYYSLDDGRNWIKYNENGIKVRKEGKILAKSIIYGEITKETQGNITMQLASDALGSKAYDNDMSTIETLRNYQKIIYIDEIAWNRKIKIYAQWGDSRLNYYIYDKNGKILSSLTTDYNRITATSTLEIKIPENAYKIGLYWQHASNYGYVNIQNIKFDNSPTIKNRYVYPVITKDGIKKEELYATIEYLESSVIKKYKINDGEWQDYKSEFQYNVGDKLYTKGIDQNGEDTFESETKYEVGSNDDGVGKNAYDGDTNTYITLSNKQRNLYIDENANIKAINVNMQLGDARLNYYIYDKEGNVLDSDTSDYTRFSTTQTKKINIPDNAYRISFYWMNAGKYGYINIKEITVEYK